MSARRDPITILLAGLGALLTVSLLAPDDWRNA